MSSIDSIIREEAIAEINSKWTHNLNCECCGHRNWKVAEDIMSAQTFIKDQPSPSVYPFMSVSCGNCGNTKFFNINYVQVLNKHIKGGK